MRTTNTHVYFWGSFLSNFYWAPFQINLNDKDHTFQTSEQCYMAMKALEFNDMDSFNQILVTPDGKSAKAIGRRVVGFDVEQWNAVSYDRMFRCCLNKFGQNHDIGLKLSETGHKTLVEASPVDLIWGVGLSETDDLILDEKNWRGENRLGRVLMDVRNFV